MDTQPGALLTTLNGTLATRRTQNQTNKFIFINVIYSERFGIYRVDYNDPERPRTQKLSARTYAQIIRDNGFPAPENK